MCGIAGIISTDAPEADLREPLSAMQAALRHRGPDDEGVFLSKVSGQKSEVSSEALGLKCGLTHTRLSILDLSPAGHQPMSTVDGRFTIVFNGEIYNFRALREELVAAGVEFRSHSDTEVILRLYERDGPECVKHLSGMFAFAIWDNRKQTCFLARDPLGIKPLYVAATEKSLIFASELRAVLASGLVKRELDAESVFGFFQTGSVPEPGTLVQGVKCLAPGSWLLWRGSEVHTGSHWSLRFKSEEMPGTGAVTQTREALLDSVRRHFVSDVPVGVFLSGGIDSTAVLALSRAVGQQDLRTFSISFDDPAFNEGDLSARTARQFGTRHADWRLQPATGRELFEQFLTRMDQPSIDGFNSFTVSKFAHDQGMKVVLSGLGGDELFGGYPTFQRIPQMLRVSRKLGPLRTLAGKCLGRSAKPQLRRLGSFLRRKPDLLAAYRAYRGVYSFDEARVLAANYVGVAAGSLGELQSTLPVQPTREDEVSELELTCYMRNQLLRDSDVMSMAWGLELRVPFVDRALLESLTGIPAAMRLQSGKKLLLQAVPEVPDWIWNRPKRGFLFPFEQWLAGDWKELFERTVKRSGARAETWYQKWSIFVFEHWCTTNRMSFARRAR